MIDLQKYYNQDYDLTFYKSFGIQENGNLGVNILYKNIEIARISWIDGITKLANSDMLKCDAIFYLDAKTLNILKNIKNGDVVELRVKQNDTGFKYLAFIINNIEYKTDIYSNLNHIKLYVAECPYSVQLFD